jgi:hypothetical protein
MTLGMLLMACATAVPEPSHLARIPISRRAPPATFRVLGRIEVVDGSGSGVFGEMGTYDGAMLKLAEKAASMGGDYVRLMTTTEPHSATAVTTLFDNRFIARGIVYGSPTPPAPPVPPRAGPTREAAAVPVAPPDAAYTPTRPLSGRRCMR